MHELLPDFTSLKTSQEHRSREDLLNLLNPGLGRISYSEILVTDRLKHD